MTIAILAFFLAAVIEVFIPTGFRPDYLINQNEYPQNSSVAYELSQFIPTGAEVKGDVVTTTTADGFLVLDEEVMKSANRVTLNFAEPVEKKTRVVVYYTQNAEQIFEDGRSVQWYVSPGDTVATIDLDTTDIYGLRIDISDEANVSLAISQADVSYVHPLSLCKEKFSIVRFLMFFAVLAFIPLELIYLNRI